MKISSRSLLKVGAPRGECHCHVTSLGLTIHLSALYFFTYLSTRSIECREFTLAREYEQTEKVDLDTTHVSPLSSQTSYSYGAWRLVLTVHVSMTQVEAPRGERYGRGGAHMVGDREQCDVTHAGGAAAQHAVRGRGGGHLGQRYQPPYRDPAGLDRPCLPGFCWGMYIFYQIKLTSRKSF